MTMPLSNSTDTIISQPLSEALREHTAKAHEDAEHSTFMNQLLKGKLDTTAFIHLQEQSWFFYSALEEAARSCAPDPRSQELLDPRLERRKTLVHDLDALHGNSTWRQHIQPTAATANYVQRLMEIASTRDFPRVVAHHYVRYLGDLSGGQIIARMMGDHYDISPEALSFYRFEDLGKIKPYKDGYRAALDALDLTVQERDTLLTEAREAFIYNQNVFNSLG